MEVTIDISKRTAQVIMVFLVLGISVLLVNAVPNPGHSASQIFIKTATGAEKNLQQAINEDVYPNKNSRNVMGLLAREALPWGTGCWESCKEFGYCGTTRTMDVGQHQVCFITVMYSDPNSNHAASTLELEKTPNNHWIVTTLNNDFQVSCLDSTLDYPSTPPSYNCLFDDEL